MDCDAASMRERLLALLARDGWKRGTFTLASGRTSDFFIDCKEVILAAEGHHLAGHLVYRALAPFFPLDAVAGVVVGGCPLASAASCVSFALPNPLDALLVRMERKDHGTGRRIEGPSRGGRARRVAIVEDVLTTGGSLRRAAEAVAGEGHQVAAAVVLVDREEGGREALADLGFPVVSVFRKKDFFDVP